MSNQQPKLPSVTNGKTTVSMTHLNGAGNNNGMNISTGAQISHQIGKNTSVFAGGTINHSQSFKGYGGHTSGGGHVGIKWRF